EEFNNQKPEWLEVAFSTPDASNTPKPRSNLTGTTGPNADLAITDLIWDPETRPFTNATYTATIQNLGPDAVADVNVTLQIGQSFGGQIFPSREQKTTVSLASGESTTVTLEFNDVTATQFWLEAFVNTTGTANDPNAENNWMAEYAPVNPRLGPESAFPDPPERLTIKRFYLDILQDLHIRILLPLIGLFYAAGVISDEKDKGNLVYILTRPVSRPLIPVLKFVSSFLVASVAVIVGILATFFLLLGTPEGNLGFLTTPLLISLISLFVYGSFFILVGVLVERPYLIGLGWVIGWETIAGNLVPWVRNFTLSHHLINAISGWRLDAGLQWLPESTEAKQALGWVIGAAFAFLIASVVVMRNREFDL
ncbi:MAG TPA: ABC transporter permease subunit, partial [Candidatus Thermoplasmatota archaeon]